MTNEELNRALYDKMSAEMAKYRDWLMSQPPEDILKNAYEYAMREDILLSMEYNDLDNEQARALLNTENPLYRVFNAFEKVQTGHMDFIQGSIENVADEAGRQEQERRRAVRETPLYLFPGAYAREHGELEQYRASRQANIACRDAIDAAVGEYFSGSHLDAAAVREVTDAFGFERVMYVLAATVRHNAWDERFSGDNKRWALTIPVYENPDGMGGDRNSDFVLRSHPVKADAFIKETRREYPLSLQERESVSEQDAMEYDEAEVFGIPALFANERISAADVPEGLYCYDLRGSDDDPGQPVAVEKHVRVNHAGTLITAEPLAIPDGGFLPLTEENGLDFPGETSTMRAFQRAQKRERAACPESREQRPDKAQSGKTRTVTERQEGGHKADKGRKRASHER